VRTKEEKAAYMRKYRQLRPGESSQYTTKWAREHREQDRKLKEKSRNKKRAELGLLGWTLKTKYHLTIEQYNVILEKQNGVCAICRKPPTPQKRLCVDHDHKCCSGKISCGKCVRGFLCDNCNRMLGSSIDSPIVLRLGAEYLEYTQGDLKCRFTETQLSVQ
jgi:hypothetical protein